MSRIAYFFLASRPYSYVCNFARGPMVCGLLGIIEGWDIWLTGTTSLLIWLFLNWFSDRRQRDEGRSSAPWWLITAPAILTAVVTVVYRPEALLYLGLLAGIIVVYPMKALYPWAGLLGPVFRGLTIAAHLLYLTALIDGVSKLTGNVILLFSTLVIMHTARNLVGDLRDIRQDRFELPAKFGVRATLTALRTLFGLTILLGVIGGQDMVPVLGFAGIIWLSIEMLVYLVGNESCHIVGYLGHRLFVVIFTFTELWIAYMHGIDAKFCILLVVVTLLFSSFYARTPGKRYPTWREVRQAFGLPGKP